MLSVIFFGMTVLLLLANFLFLGVHILACIKRRYYHLLPAALLMPFYWLLISVGAWKGFIQLFFNPFYWEKTVHGLDDGSRTVNTSFEQIPSGIKIIAVHETTAQTAEENKLL